RSVAMTGEIDTTPAMAAWTVDTVAPMAPVITYPADGSTIGTTTVDVAGTSEPNSAVTLSLDGVALASGVTDATGHWTISIGVSMGMHTVTVRASDAAGNVSPVSAPVGFTVDTSVRDTFIASRP